MTTKTVAYHNIGQLSKGLKEKITNGALKYMEIKNMAETYLGKMNNDSLEIVPKLAESLPRKTKNSENQQTRTFTDMKAKSLEEVFVGFTGGHISFVGPAGSGKSTLLRTISRNVIAQKYQALLEVEVVVYIKCGDLDTSKLTTAPKLLLSFIQPQLDENELDEFTEYAKNNPQKVLFVLDGLDTLPGYFYQTAKSKGKGKQNVGTDDTKKKVKSILCKMMEGKIFPDCRVITSSRDNSELGQCKMFTIRVVNLVGLETSSIKYITYQYFLPEEAEKIFLYLEKQPALLELCQTPMFLVFTLIGKKRDPNFAPTTMSEILVFLFDCLIRSEHTKLSEHDIQNLEEFCYDLMTDFRVNFSITDLKRYQLSLDKVHDLVISSPGGQQRTLFFVHQSILEILACFHISKLKHQKFTKVIKGFFFPNLYNHFHFAIIEQMLCGILLNKDLANKWGSILEVNSVEEKRKALKNHLSERLQLIKKTEPTNALFVLDLILSLHEAGESVDGMIKEYLDSIVLDCLFPFHFLSMSDVRAIGSVIARCHYLQKFAINRCFVCDEHIDVLYTCIFKSPPEISKMEFECNFLTPKGMKRTGLLITCCRVKHMSFAVSGAFFFSDRSQAGLGSLKTALQDYQLERLDISFCVERLRESEMADGEISESNEIVVHTVEEDQLSENVTASICTAEVRLEFPPIGIYKEASFEITSAMVSLMNNVTERLDAYNWKFTGDEKNLFQEKLDKISSMELRVALAEDLVLSAREQSGQKAAVSTTKSRDKPEEPDSALKPVQVNENCEIPSFSDLNNLQSHPEMTKLEDYNWVQKIRILHRVVTEEELSKLTGILPNLNSLEEIELRNCNASHGMMQQLFEILKKYKTMVSTLSVTATSNIGQLLPAMFDIMEACQAKGLNVEESEKIDDFLEFFEKAKQERKIESLCHLNMSYNKNIDAFGKLGGVLSDRVTELQLVNCDLETENLDTMCNALADSKVQWLDVSYNTELDENDIKLLPKLLDKGNVKLLAMRGCELSIDEIEGFEDKGFDDVKVDMMDLSYNATLQCDGVRIVGKTARKLCTKKLALGSCGLDEDCLKSLMISLGTHNLTHLDLRDNVKIASSSKTVAALVHQCNTKTLNVSNCKLEPDQISYFAKALTKYNFKLKLLDVSDSERTLDENFVKAICELIHIVDEELIACFATLEDTFKDQIQTSLNKSPNKMLRVVYRQSQQEKDAGIFTLVGTSVPEYLIKE